MANNRLNDDFEGDNTASVQITYLPVDDEAATGIIELFEAANRRAEGPTIQHPSPGADWDAEFSSTNEFALLGAPTYGDRRRFNSSTVDRIVLLGAPPDDLIDASETQTVKLTALSRNSRVTIEVPLSWVRQKPVPRNAGERIVKRITDLRRWLSSRIIG